MRPGGRPTPDFTDVEDGTSNLTEVTYTTGLIRHIEDIHLMSRDFTEDLIVEIVVDPPFFFLISKRILAILTWSYDSVMCLIFQSFIECFD